MKAHLMIGFIALSCLFANGRSAFCQEPNGGDGPKGGDRCKVTSGPNQGKVGTYTEGGTWCEGSWGGTQCTDQDGKSNGKCSSALTRPIFSPVEIAMLQAYFEAAASPQPDALTAWQTRYKTKVVKMSEAGIRIFFKDRVLTFDGSREALAKQFTKPQVKGQQ